MAFIFKFNPAFKQPFKKDEFRAFNSDHPNHCHKFKEYTYIHYQFYKFQDNMVINFSWFYEATNHSGLIYIIKHTHTHKTEKNKEENSLHDTVIYKPMNFITESDFLLLMRF